MIAIYPLLLVCAAVLVGRRSGSGDASRGGFGAWVVAGAVFAFSLLTGLSIGLFLLPLVIAAVYLAVRRAPELRASVGFVGGIGVTVLGLAAVNGFTRGWVIPGIAFTVVGLAAFLAAEQVTRRGRA